MIYLVSLIVIFISFVIFSNVSGGMALNKINMISIIFYFYLMLVSYPGAVLIANGYGSNPALNHISDAIRFKGWLIVSYVMISVPIGIYLSKILSGVKNSSQLFDNYINSEIKTVLSKKDSIIKLFLYLLSLVCVISTFYVVINVGMIPQIQLLTLDSHIDVLTMRTNININFNGIYQVKSIFFEQLLPILSFISYSYYKMTKTKYDLLWFSLMLVLTIFMLTFTLSKSPLIGYVISFVIMKVYIDGKYGWKKLILLGSVIFLGLITFFIFIVRDGDASFISFYLFNRFIYDQISGTFLMLHIFPDIYDFIGFNSFSNLISNLFYLNHSDNAARIAMNFAFPAATESGYMNLLSTLFIGESWANFGFIGVLFSPLYVGFITGLFYFSILKSPKTPLFIGILSYFSFRVCFGTQFNSYIYNLHVYVIIILLVMSYLLSIFLKDAYDKNIETS